MYIEREAVVKYIRSREGNFIDDMGKGWSNGMDAAASICEKFPAAAVVPVVHGRWEVYLGGKELMCSACKATFWDEDGVGGSNYCPNCGAKMDGAST